MTPAMWVGGLLALAALTVVLVLSDGELCAPFLDWLEQRRRR